MKLTKKAIAIAMLGIGLSSIAYAQNGYYNMGHFYLSAQAGYGGMNKKSETVSGVSLTQKSKGFSYRVSGGYLFNISNNFVIGPEIGYFGYPDNKYKANGTTVYKFTGQVIDLLANARFYFADNFYVLGKAGIAYTRQKAKDEITNTTKSKILPEASLGVGYKFMKNLSADISYTRVFGKDRARPDQVATVDAVMAGISYLF